MWRIGIILAFITAAAVMAYQIGSRLSDEAIMTIAGVTCGILASIPVSIGLLIALTRERVPPESGEYIDVEPEPAPASYPIYKPAPPQSPPPSQQPQIIVVAPPQQQMPGSYSPYGNYLQPPMNALPAPMQERNFKIVGEDDDDG